MFLFKANILALKGFGGIRSDWDSGVGKVTRESGLAFANQIALDVTNVVFYGGLIGDIEPPVLLPISGMVQSWHKDGG